jgi:hAT family C-terminal dimerisation region
LFGCPLIFLSINPHERYTPLALFYAGEEINVPAPNDDAREDDEFLALLADRAAQRSGVHGYDRYANLPNDPTIESALGWWRGNRGLFPDLAKMARDTLAVPASDCFVEWMFSVSGHIATWQRSRLQDTSTISDLMMYKAAMNLKDVAPELEE